MSARSPALFDMPAEWQAVEHLYDGTGRHLWGFYPPLAVGNVLTPAFHANKAVRPVGDSLFLYDRDAGADLALVWMMAPALPSDVALPRNVIAAMVLAIDARRTVVVHGDSPDLVARVRATVGLLCGGGHA